MNEEARLSSALVMPTPLAIDRSRIADACRRHHIRKLSLFGSALRGDFRPDSDVDLLVEWKAEARPGFDILDVEDDFSALLGGRRIDLVNAKYVYHRLRDRILASAEVLYDEG